MYMHAGSQYNDSPTMYTKNLTEWLLKNGVDIVVGSHEHVVHGGDFTRKEKGKMVTYSLGNFDGVNGVYEAPLDKMSEYSIAWHIYFEKQNDTAKIAKTGFSILKCIGTVNGKVETIPAYDLIQKTDDFKEKEKLWADMRKIALIFSGDDISILGPREEYLIK